jgi:hypothetical protein
MRFLHLFIAACISSCAAQNPAVPMVPSCIAKRIEELKSQPKQNPPASIEQYEYMGKTVYLFSAPCCDFYNVLVDENCNQLCAPSGGFTGKGDGKCPNFNKEAKYIKLVWKDER